MDSCGQSLPISLFFLLLDTIKHKKEARPRLILFALRARQSWSDHTPIKKPRPPPHIEFTSTILQIISWAQGIEYMYKLINVSYVNIIF